MHLLCVLTEANLSRDKGRCAQSCNCHHAPQSSGDFAERPVLSRELGGGAQGSVFLTSSQVMSQLSTQSLRLQEQRDCQQSKELRCLGGGLDADHH